MSVLQSLKETSNKATYNGERFIETSKRYYELKVFQQLTLGLSLVSKIALIGGFLFIGFIFLMIAATIALGEYLGNTATSACIVALTLFGLALTIYLLRKKIDKSIIKKVGAEFFEQ